MMGQTAHRLIRVVRLFMLFWAMARGLRHSKIDQSMNGLGDGGWIPGLEGSRVECRRGGQPTGTYVPVGAR